MKLLSNEIMGLADHFSEAEKVILFSAVERNGVFWKKCEIKWSNEGGIVLSDGEFIYPLGKIDNSIGFEKITHSGILGKFDNVRKILNFRKTKKWTVMEKEFAKFEATGKFEELSAPREISMKMVNNARQLSQFCCMKGQFLEEESGEVIDVNRLYESLGESYLHVCPALISHEGEEIGIISSNFFSQKGSMINMLFIKKEFRLRGYGKLLLKWYINQLLKNSKNMYLFYSPKNKPAMNIYRELGFVRIEKWLMAI